jgi:Flp pilus assembly protein TadG
MRSVSPVERVSPVLHRLRLTLHAERGSVTAEFAAVLPAVVLVFAVALGGMQIAGEQLRLQSAVADAARMLGRGDSGAASRVRDAASGARLSESRQGDLVCATARAPTSLGFLFAITLSASSCALDDAAPE